MASGARTGMREAERRLSVTTLAIASVASATAAIVVSQFWTSGTPLAAAVTPVIVALVSELLRRPTERIAQRLTTDSHVVLPDAAGAAPPAPPHEHALPDRAPAEPGTAPPRPFETQHPLTAGTGPPRRPRSAQGPVRVYGRRRRRRRVAVGVVALTAALAFALSAAALTLPELIAGQSIGKSDRGTTLFGGHAKKKAKNEGQQEQQQPTQTTPQEGREQQPSEQGTGTTTTTPTPEEGAPSTTQPQQPQGGASTAPAPAPKGK